MSLAAQTALITGGSKGVERASVFLWQKKEQTLSLQQVIRVRSKRQWID